jgi:transcriptional regulator with XRE-family HTH domain
MSKVHIGKKIKEVVERSEFTVSGFAEKIGLTRDGANKIFKKDSVATDQLQKISKVLDHDFFRYYQDEKIPLNEKKETTALHDPKTTYGFATKEDIENLTGMMRSIMAEIEKLKKESVKRSSSPRRKSKKK